MTIKWIKNEEYNKANQTNITEAAANTAKSFGMNVYDYAKLYDFVYAAVKAKQYRLGGKFNIVLDRMMPKIYGFYFRDIKPLLPKTVVMRKMTRLDYLIAFECVHKSDVYQLTENGLTTIKSITPIERALPFIFDGYVFTDTDVHPSNIILNPLKIK